MLLFKERRVRHLPRWGVGALDTLDKHGGGLAVVRELNAALPPPSPVVSGSHPSLPPTPAGHGGAVGRHGVSLILQAGCHGTAVDQFDGGTEKAPTLSLVTHCQVLDAQGESQANEFIRQGFNLICAVYTFE